jgi:prevent-host-death family protein
MSSDPLFSISTNNLRDNLSETVSRAAFGKDPVIVTRRGRKIAGLVSFSDLVFLEKMKARKAELMAIPLPKDPAKVGPALAEKLNRELFFL